MAHFRSRSVMIPTSVPFFTTGRWRIRWRSMSSHTRSTRSSGLIVMTSVCIHSCTSSGFIGLPSPWSSHFSLPWSLLLNFTLLQDEIPLRESKKGAWAIECHLAYMCGTSRYGFDKRDSGEVPWRLACQGER
jgi:hypothetical protein